jgi:hypothetical protein
MKHQAEYEQMLVSEENVIRTWRGLHMKEEIGDEVRISYKLCQNCGYINILLDTLIQCPDKH